jgi:hypothetical protein
MVSTLEKLIVEQHFVYEDEDGYLFLVLGTNPDGHYPLSGTYLTGPRQTLSDVVSTTGAVRRTGDRRADGKLVKRRELGEIKINHYYYNTTGQIIRITAVETDNNRAEGSERLSGKSFAYTLDGKCVSCLSRKSLEDFSLVTELGPVDMVSFTAGRTSIEETFQLQPNMDSNHDSKVDAAEGLPSLMTDVAYHTLELERIAANLGLTLSITYAKR